MGDIPESASGRLTARRVWLRRCGVPNDPGAVGQCTTVNGSWLCNGLGRLVWTLRDATATVLEPQPLGDKETGWQVLDDGRPKLARRALHCPLKMRRSCRWQRASFPTGDSRKASTVGTGRSSNIS